MIPFFLARTFQHINLIFRLVSLCPLSLHLEKQRRLIPAPSCADLIKRCITHSSMGQLIFVAGFLTASFLLLLASESQLLRRKLKILGAAFALTPSTFWKIMPFKLEPPLS